MIKVSVLIVTYKRERLLLNCLRSLNGLNKFFELEIVLFVNGEKLPLEISQEFKNLSVLENERVTPGIARNIALNHATGDWIFFLDDDAFLPLGYEKQVSEIIDNHPKIECFGGPDTLPPNSAPFQESLAIALTSPFCTGPTSKRHTHSSGHPFLATERDLTSCHLWIKKELIQKHSLKFAEDFHRGEETVFLNQISDSGIEMWSFPTLYVFHERRKKISELLRPLFYGGFYRAELTKGLFSIFALPSLFLLLHLILFINLPLFIILGEVYFILIAIMSFWLCLKNKKIQRTAQVIVLHYLMITLYGAGFIWQKLKKLLS